MNNKQLLHIVLSAVRDAADNALSALGSNDYVVEAVAEAKPAEVIEVEAVVEDTPDAPAEETVEVAKAAEDAAPTATAAVTAIDLETASRPEIVKFIKDNGIDKTPEFEESIGTLVRIRRTKLVSFLEEYLSGEGAEVQSQQSPPPTSVEPEVLEEAPIDIEVVEEKVAAPTNGLDNESIEKAEQMIGAFNDWLKDGETSPDVQAFWSKWGCDGNCLAHDKASIDRCYERLSA